MYKFFSKTIKKDPLFEVPPIILFNSESRSLQEFTTIKNNQVTIYSCGPTVYDFAHIGNLRAFVFADILKRTIEYNGYEVNHTMNFTDFGHLTDENNDSGEDKIMKGLRREGLEISLKSMRTLSDRYISAFKDDAQALNIIPPTQYSRASDYVKEQINLIKTLDEKGYIYKTTDGLYFDIAKFPTYGRLGKIDINTLKNGARIETNIEKKHPADFAVWKKSKLGWDSPWGKGFPGWHIECSAMAFATLGKHIDIHTGGVDNAPTHHNAEIAQCESATGKKFVNYWLHSEHIQIGGGKISKSEGNGLTLRDLIGQGFSGTDYRYWLLTSHYRTQVNFSTVALEASKQAFVRLRQFVFKECTDESGKINHDYRQKFVTAINNDLDTPKAISYIWELLKNDSVSEADKRSTIIEMDAVLGLNLAVPIEEGLKTLGFIDNNDITADISKLLEEREVARIARNWPEADRLRDQLTVSGYSVEDTPEGPKLSKL